MMTNLMTISVKKASISSKPTTVYLSCPPLCGLFSIQQNANGGLSYKVKKNPACRILRLRRVALATLFHSAAVRSLAERFLCHRTKFPYDMKKRALTLLSTLSKLIIVTVQYLHSHKSIFNYSASSAGACSAFMLKLIFLSASLKSTILASIS